MSPSNFWKSFRVVNGSIHMADFWGWLVIHSTAWPKYWKGVVVYIFSGTITNLPTYKAFCVVSKILCNYLEHAW
jgi:hypothetical protein